jgi:tetratricopeptide (TPR) repeat protein
MPEPGAIERIDNLRVVSRFTDAEQLIRTALATEPQDARLLWRLAAVLLGTQRVAEGLHASGAAVGADPQNPDAQRLHALLLTANNRHGEATYAGHSAVTLAPQHAHTVTVYAHVLKCAGRYADAAAVARRAVELAPNDPDTHMEVGDVALSSGDRQTARTAYENVLALDPGHATARRNLAAVDVMSRRPRLALGGLVEAGRINPDTPQVLPIVAAVLWQLSWRMRIGLVIALVPVLIVGAKYGNDASWATRTVGAVVLMLAAVVTWWHVRGLPRGTGRVIIAALRGDGLLMATYLFIAFCLVVYVAVGISGVAPVAAIIWPIAILLSIIAVVSRIAGGFTRRAQSRRR